MTSRNLLALFLGYQIAVLLAYPFLVRLSRKAENPFRLIERLAGSGIRRIPYEENRYRPRIAVPIAWVIVTLFGTILYFFGSR